jgi:hypothetical protein
MRFIFILAILVVAVSAQTDCTTLESDQQSLCQQQIEQIGVYIPPDSGSYSSGVLTITKEVDLTGLKDTVKQVVVDTQDTVSVRIGDRTYTAENCKLDINGNTLTNQGKGTSITINDGNAVTAHEDGTFTVGGVRINANGAIVDNNGVQLPGGPSIDLKKGTIDLALDGTLTLEESQFGKTSINVKDFTGNIRVDKDGVIIDSIPDGEKISLAGDFDSPGGIIGGKNIRLSGNQNRIDAETITFQGPHGTLKSEGYLQSTDDGRTVITANTLDKTGQFNLQGLDLAAEHIESSNGDKIWLSRTASSIEASVFRCEGVCFSHVDSKSEIGFAKAQNPGISGPFVDFVKDGDGWHILSQLAQTKVSGTDASAVSMQDSSASFRVKVNGLDSVSQYDGQPFVVDVTKGGKTSTYDSNPDAEPLIIRFGEPVEGEKNTVFVVDADTKMVTEGDAVFCHTGSYRCIDCRTNSIKESIKDVDIKTQYSQETMLTPDGKMKSAKREGESSEWVRYLYGVGTNELPSVIRVFESQSTNPEKDFQNKLMEAYGLTADGAEKLYRTCMDSGECKKTGNAIETYGISAKSVFQEMPKGDFKISVDSSTLTMKREETAKNTLTNYKNNIKTLTGYEYYGDIGAATPDSFIGYVYREHYSVTGMQVPDGDTRTIVNTDGQTAAMDTSRSVSSADPWDSGPWTVINGEGVAPVQKVNAEKAYMTKTAIDNAKAYNNREDQAAQRESFKELLRLRDYSDQDIEYVMNNPEYIKLIQENALGLKGKEADGKIGPETGAQARGRINDYQNEISKPSADLTISKKLNQDRNSMSNGLPASQSAVYVDAIGIPDKLVAAHYAIPSDLYTAHLNNGKLYSGTLSITTKPGDVQDINLKEGDTIAIYRLHSDGQSVWNTVDMYYTIKDDKFTDMKGKSYERSPDYLLNAIKAGDSNQKIQLIRVGSTVTIPKGTQVKYSGDVQIASDKASQAIATKQNTPSASVLPNVDVPMGS